jgi:hypothetical protein
MNVWSIRAALAYLVFISAVPLLVGCNVGLVSNNPLSDPATAKLDERLLGEWKMPDEALASALHEKVIVEKIVHAEHPAGVLRLTLIPKKADQPKRYAWAFCTDLEDKAFLSVCVNESDSTSLPRWNKGKGFIYRIFKYEISDGGLTLWNANIDKLEQAVLNKEVKGFIIPAKRGEIKTIISFDQPKQVRMSDSGENLARFVIGKDKEDLFDKKYVFTRSR